MMFHQRSSEPHELLNGNSIFLWRGQHVSDPTTEHRLQKGQHGRAHCGATATRLALNSARANIEGHKV